MRLVKTSELPIKKYKNCIDREKNVSYLNSLDIIRSKIHSKKKTENTFALFRLQTL